MAACVPMPQCRRMNIIEAKGTALITGATGGIGTLYAERLLERGYDVILVARNQRRLDDMVARLGRQTPYGVEGMAADLGNDADLAFVESRLAKDERITMLVNNAGVGATAPLLETPMSEIDRMIGINVRVLTRLSRAVAPAFVARGSGAIINIASVVAIAPELLNGVYGASKAYVLAFSQSLLHELAAHGVRVQVVMPGATATKFWAESGKPVEELPQEWVMSAETMVDAAMAGFDLGEFATIPSLPDVGDWETLEAARRSLRPNLSRAQPAGRYRA
jgi:short-subunit dehydrogenase